MTDQASRSTTDDERRRFEEMWMEPSGFPGTLATVDNMRIGVRYIVTAFSFFLIAGVFALLMRVQLAVPANTFLGPDVYNQLFTMHGTTMMYLFAVPFMEGLAILFLPFMLGIRDLAYPRLTAFSYWIFLFSGVTFYSGFLFDMVSDVGWFAYTPLSSPAFAKPGIDFWLVALGAAELAGISAGVELTVSILRLRAPGMNLARMPLFAWAWLATAIMIVFAFTTLFVATMLLESDHAIGTHFFNDRQGGNHLLWQHLFWFFGHPEVYIIFLPATGIVSMIVSAFAGRILGYTLIAVAIVFTAFLSFGLWVHHMYTTGLPELSLYFFVAASLMISLASGTQIFAWIGSLWGRRPEFKTPLLYVLGFIAIFVFGGLTGVMVAIAPFDWQVHDTYFLVAHFHYVLIGGAVFPMLAGMHYWFPKLTGRLLSDRLGKCEFWLSFIGFNATFFPMHIMGLLGMPRRVYTYAEGLGLGGYNLLATVGAFVLAAGFGLFVLNVFWSLDWGKQAGPNPWRSDSLEWSFESAPQVLYPRLPVVSSRHPLWDAQFQINGAADQPPPSQSLMSSAADPGPSSRNTHGVLSAEQLVHELDHRPAEWRATLLVDTVTAEPQALVRLARPSYMPLVTAAGIIIASWGTIARSYLLIPLGFVVAAGAIIVWLIPDRRELERIRRSSLSQRTGLPTLPIGGRSLGWMGFLWLLITIGWGLSTLIYAYFYLRLYSPEWPQGGVSPPDRWSGALMYGLPLAACAAAGLAWRLFRSGQRVRQLVCQGLAAALAATFLAVHLRYLANVPFSPRTNALRIGVLHAGAGRWTPSCCWGSASRDCRGARASRTGPLGVVPARTLVSAHFWCFAAGTALSSSQPSICLRTCSEPEADSWLHNIPRLIERRRGLVRVSGSERSARAAAGCCI